MAAPHAHPSATWVVLLAAGAGRRFDAPFHKLDAEIDPGLSIGCRAITVALDAEIGPVAVVTGAHRLVGLDELLARASDRLIEVPNPSWEQGQITSVRAGIEIARHHGADAVVIGLADQPFITSDAWRAVAASDAPIAVATYDGQRANPVRLHHSVWELLPETGDEGARSLIRLRPDLVDTVVCEGSSIDIDTWEDLKRWQRS
jgi:CTP:molybdopterin cytidylyltransferase MocA